MGRIVGPGEPQWLPDDVDLALEWQAEQALICPGCGHPLDETTAADSEDAYDVREIRCWGCHPVQEAAHEFEGERHGLRFVAVRSEE